MSEKTLYERLEKLSKESASTDMSQITSDAEDNTEDKIVLPLVGGPNWKAKPRTDLVRGELYRGRKITFCPWEVVTNYHEWFVGKKNRERVRPYHELKALLGHQKWDFYYVWHPTSDQKSKNAILIPTDQFNSFLTRLNDTLKTQLSIPYGNHGKKFRVSFGEHGTPVPRFLGHATNLDKFRSIVDDMPLPNQSDTFAGMSHIAPESRDMYRQKIDGLFKNHEKGKPKNTQKSLQAHKIWGMQAKRVQRYLGLRGKIGQAPDHGPPGIPKQLDLDMPSPYIPNRDVIFVAMDIESYEFNTRMVTEIGFGILDTRDIDGVAPGHRGAAWHEKIHGRHIRVREHAHAVNRVYVHGCENNFNFGTSEFIKLQDIPSLLKEILQPVSPNGEPREVVLVGHSIDCDLSFVKHVGFDMKRDAKFRDIVDTQDMHRHLCMTPQNTGLSRLLRELELEYSFLHNGGNDAVYTLQAMITLSIMKRDVSLKRHHEKQEAGYKSDPLAVEGGWDTGGENSDGSTSGYRWMELSDVEEKPKGKAKVIQSTKEVDSTPQAVNVSEITTEQADALWGTQSKQSWGAPWTEDSVADTAY